MLVRTTSVENVSSSEKDFQVHLMPGGTLETTTETMTTALSKFKC